MTSHLPPGESQAPGVAERPDGPEADSIGSSASLPSLAAEGVQVLEEQAEHVAPLSLQQHLDKYRRLPQVTEEEVAAAVAYYRSWIFGDLVAHARERCGRPAQGYDLLITTVGQSPEPLAVTAALLEPQRIVFLVTRHTERFISFVTACTGIAVSRIDKEYVQKDDSRSVYEALLKSVKVEAERLGRQPRVAIDMTGGTKVMVASAAMAGVVIDADIYYLARDGDEPLHLAPLAEQGGALVQFEDPYKYFGDFDVQRAVGRFNRHDYTGAAELFQEIADRVASPRTYECLAALSRGYEAWNRLRFGEAAAALGSALAICRRFRSDSMLLRNLDVTTLEGQRQALERMCECFDGQQVSLDVLRDDDSFVLLLCTVYQNAWRLQRSQSYDAASLLLYRTLEMMAQRRFALRGVDASQVDYSLLGLDPQADVERVNEALPKSAQFRFVGQLPRKLAMQSSYSLLVVLGDDYVARGSKFGLGVLGNVISTRNQGLFAHGFKPTDLEAYERFASFASSCLDRLCEVEGWRRAELEKRYRFIHLG